MRPSKLVVVLVLPVALVLALGAQATGGRLKLPAHIQARTLTVPILTYHRVDLLRPTLPEVTRKLTVDPSDFAAQMRWLKSHDFHTLTQKELFMALVRGKRLPSKPVLITFDDGYRDIFVNAAPVLERLGLKATAYVITRTDCRAGRELPQLEAAARARASRRRGRLAHDEPRAADVHLRREGDA